MHLRCPHFIAYKFCQKERKRERRKEKGSKERGKEGGKEGGNTYVYLHQLNDQKFCHKISATFDPEGCIYFKINFAIINTLLNKY